MVNNYFISSEQAAKENNGQLIEQSGAQQAASQNTADELKQATAEDTRQLADGLSDTDKAVDDGFSEIPPESQAETEPKLSRHGFDLGKLTLWMEDEIPDPVPILIETGTGLPVLTEKDVSLIYGGAKSRKTTLVHLFSGALLGKKGLGFEAARDGYKVLIADTEQSLNFVAKGARRIYRMMGWNEKETNERLVVCPLLDPSEGQKFRGFEQTTMREPDQRKRLLALEDLLEKHHPNMVFVDGLVDICPDFNDIPKSQEVVTQLRKLAEKYNCHITCVLHTNKDGKTERGTLGSTMKQKGQCSFFVRKIDEKVSKVTPECCRLLPFQPFYFGLDEDGLPYRLSKEEEKRAKNKEEAQDRAVKLLRAAFRQNDWKPMKRVELARAMSSLSDEVLGFNVAYDTALGHIDKARKVWELLEKSENGEYLFKDPEDELQQKFDFENNDEE